MSMSHGGLTKLVEECGELTQVAAKRIAYPEGDHPDGKGCLNDRLDDEIADVLAASNKRVESFADAIKEREEVSMNMSKGQEAARVKAAKSSKPGSRAWVSTVMEQVFEECRTLRAAGQKEYAHDDANAFANFDDDAEETGASRETVLSIFANKHWRGIRAWIGGHKSQREDVRGRINDMIVYLVLLRGMVEQAEAAAAKPPEKIAFVARRGDSPVETPVRLASVQEQAAKTGGLCAQPGCPNVSAGTSWGNCVQHWGTLPPNYLHTVAATAPRESAPEGRNEGPTVVAPPSSATEWVKECDGLTTGVHPGSSSPADFLIQHRGCRTVWFDDPGNPTRVCACPCLCCTRSLKHRGSPAIVGSVLETDADRLVREHRSASQGAHPSMPSVFGPLHAPPPAPRLGE